MGTLINAAAIVLAAAIGTILKRGLPQHLQRTVLFTMGLALVALSLGWFLSDFLQVANGTLKSRFELLILVSLVLGTLIGEKLDIDGRIHKAAQRVEDHYNLPPVAKGFVTATIIFCVGALAILGPIQEATTGNIAPLLVKSGLDFTTGMMLAAVYGIGVAFAAASVLLYQGAFFFIGILAGDLMGAEAIAAFSMVGNIILIAMGLSFMRIVDVKPANMLPALLIPVIYFLLFG